eukprot:TRINITY_DN47009_c0_g1_i1.p1 TRINITY_DN47009_c0_g1~~TRINITY_DN47009_c0_g1_i1.p1  ORF type:complete len:334 (+),score=91.81 TRINITY_DN47009_c0_g1_i1:37-1002(+)
MGNTVPAVSLKESICCTDVDSTLPEEMISADLAQALFLHEVPVHVNARMEGPSMYSSGQARSSSSSSPKKRSKEQSTRRRLLSAVQHDDAPAVLQFVADGIDTEEMSEALRLAAGRGSASVVRELVAVGLCVNEGCRTSGFTPLQLAAAGGHVVVSELLLDALADVNRQVDGINALSLARKMGNVEVEEVLERHVAALMMQDQGNADEAAQYRRAHVLPRVSAVLSEAVLNAVPFEDSVKEELTETCEVDPELISNNTNNTSHTIAEMETQSQTTSPGGQEVHGLGNDPKDAGATTMPSKVQTEVGAEEKSSAAVLPMRPL